MRLADLTAATGQRSAHAVAPPLVGAATRLAASIKRHANGPCTWEFADGDSLAELCTLVRISGKQFRSYEKPN